MVHWCPVLNPIIAAAAESLIYETMPWILGLVHVVFLGKPLIGACSSHSASPVIGTPSFAVQKTGGNIRFRRNVAAPKAPGNVG